MDESGKVNSSQAGDIDDKLKAEVDLSDDKNQQQDQQQAAFDLTILVPKSKFTEASSIKYGRDSPVEVDNISDLSQYLHLSLPAGGADCIRDIKQTIAESAEGFWIGAHSFVRILLKEDVAVKEGEVPKIVIDGKPSEVLDDTMDLAHVFEGDAYRNQEIQRILKVVETPYTDAEARSHVLRLHDTNLGYALALQAKKLYQPPPYDPSALAIQSGLTVFPSICAAKSEDVKQPAVDGSDQNGVHINGHDGSNHSRSSKRTRGKDRMKNPLKQIEKPVSNAQLKVPTSKSMDSSWLTATQDPLQVHLDRQNHLAPASPPTAAFNNLQLSIWNPPPHAFRLRGHLLYLSITTLEGDNLHITSCQSGFFISQSDNQHFDPSPMRNSGTSRQHYTYQTYHSLFTLLSAASPQFALTTESLLSENLPTSLQFFASAMITNCIPASPWLAESPDIVPDGARSQLAYLYTGSLNAESLPVARDWNEELTSMRELPRETNEDRLVRDRFASRFFSEFQAAAARAAASIGRGDVPCLNAAEVTEAKSYLVNNILFTQARDSVEAFAHLGRDEAARVTAGKDLWATKLLNDADIPNLHPIATSVIDYAGERWVAQAIPPGIFNRALDEVEEENKTKAPSSANGADKPKLNGDSTETVIDNSHSKAVGPAPAGLRAVYGPANTDKPYEGYIASQVFEPLAEKIARNFHLAKHAVMDTKGRETHLWTAADMHGIIAADGRAYVIDLFRLFPVDVNFLEKNLEDHIVNSEGDSEGLGDDKYPHRIVLLRPEMIELYHATKAREWMEQLIREKAHNNTNSRSLASGTKIGEHNSEDKSSNEDDGATSEGYVEVGIKDTTGQEDIPDRDEKQKTQIQEETLIDTDNFKLAFNPDAFVDRPDRELHTATSTKPALEEDSTKAVRDASSFLRDVVIPSLLRDVVSDEIIPLDSAHLSQIFHRRGINMRYLGLIAHETRKTPQMLSKENTLVGSAEPEVLAFLAKFKDCLVRDMVVRGAKHILRRYIAGLRTVELIEAISHVFNCLLGTSYEASPLPVNSTASSSSWTTLTPSIVQQEILREIRRRFRYQLSSTYFKTELHNAQLLRELCLSAGIQLALQPYYFEKPATPVNASESAFDGAKGKNGSTASLVTNGHRAGSASFSKGRITTFLPDDIVNIYAVPKKAPFKSALAEDFFERGQMYHLRGNIDLGEAFISDALNFHEQIFGSVHPEMAEAYRTLANLYHRLAQPLLRRIQIFEASLAMAREEDRTRARSETELTDAEALQTAKAHYELFSQQAVRLARQSVVIYERTVGLDSQETLHCYSDLAIFESQINNTELAMQCLQHTVALSNIMYGDHHPEKAKAAFFAATMVKKPLFASIPFYKSAQELAKKAYGPNSIIGANSAYQLSQCCIVSGQLSESIPYITEALRIFEGRAGKESEAALEAAQLLAAVRQAVEQKERGESAKVEKLAKRIGSDPARAKELISQMQNSFLAEKKLLGTAVETENGVISTDRKDKTGSRGHLEVDELVLYIEGEKKQTSGLKCKTGRKAMKKERQTKGL